MVKHLIAKEAVKRLIAREDEKPAKRVSPEENGRTVWKRDSNEMFDRVFDCSEWNPTMWPRSRCSSVAWNIDRSNDYRLWPDDKWNKTVFGRTSQSTVYNGSLTDALVIEQCYWIFIWITLQACVCVAFVSHVLHTKLSTTNCKQ